MAADAAPSLRHIIVVGGTTADWAALGDAQWATRLTELGKVADHAGASWLTLRPLAGDAQPELRERTAMVGACLVAAEPEADGRARVAAAVERLRAGGRPIDEAGIAAGINAPAQADPDLVVVLGPTDRLPPSLVWELAYSELVFLTVDWTQLVPAHLADAVESYTHRHRRFGGVD
jgi:undecaprenyl diphosphate synthase